MPVIASQNAVRRRLGPRARRLRLAAFDLARGVDAVLDRLLDPVSERLPTPYALPPHRASIGSRSGVDQAAARGGRRSGRCSTAPPRRPPPPGTNPAKLRKPQVPPLCQHERGAAPRLADHPAEPERVPARDPCVRPLRQRQRLAETPCGRTQRGREQAHDVGDAGPQPARGRHQVLERRPGLAAPRVAGEKPRTQRLRHLDRGLVEPERRQHPGAQQLGERQPRHERRAPRRAGRSRGSSSRGGRPARVLPWWP